MTRKLLLAGVAALTMGGATLTATSAEAQIYYPPGAGWGATPYQGGAWGAQRLGAYGGAWRGQRVGGYYGGHRGYYGGHRVGGYYGGYRPGFYGGYRPVGYYGGYRSVGYYPRYGYPYYRQRRSNAGAVAAGLIGGLALGAIVANAARPAYYYPATTVATSCWIERRRMYTRRGRVVIRQVQVCG